MLKTYTLDQQLAGLRQQKLDTLATMRSLAEIGHDLTANEDRQFESLKARALTLTTSINKIEKSIHCDGEMMPDENMAFAALARGESPMADPRGPQRKTKGYIGAKSWTELFGPAQGNGGFQSMQEYLKAVKLSGQGQFDPRLQMASTDSNPTSAGFLVPELWAQEVLNYALETSIVLARARVFPISAGESLNIPAVADDDHSAGQLFGNIAEVWADELQTLNPADMKTRLLKLTVNKLALLANASSELTEDSPTFESLLTANLQAAASFFLDKNFLFGSGAARPLGMLDPGNPALLVQTVSAGTDHNGFTFEDATNMYGSMAPACRSRAIWLFSNDLLPALAVMQLVVRDSSGDPVGGSATPQFVMNSDYTGVLLGRPAIFTEKMKTAGSQAAAAFVCPDQYGIGIRREMQLRRSPDAGFLNDSIFWRLTTRVDGQPLWAKKLKTSNGQYVSPFVVLGATV